MLKRLRVTVCCAYQPSARLLISILALNDLLFTSFVTCYSQDLVTPIYGRSLVSTSELLLSPLEYALSIVVTFGVRAGCVLFLQTVRCILAWQSFVKQCLVVKIIY